MDEFTVTKPKRRPLHAGRHLVITEDGIHAPQGIGELGRGVDRLVVVVDGLGKLQWAEDRVRVGGDHAGERGFDGGRDERGGSRRGCVRDSRRVRDAGGKGDGRSKSDCGGEGDGGCQAWGG